MRRILITLLLFLATLPASASASATGIGLARHRLPAGHGHPPVPFVLLYPTHAKARSLQVGPFRLRAAADAPPAPLRGLVLVSHGSGGGPLSLLDTERALARAGWLVAAPLYLGDSAPDHSRSGTRAMFLARARASSAVIDYLQHDPGWSRRLPAGRIAVLGYSAGGATALALIGAKASLRNVVVHCRHLPAEGLCRDGAGKRSRADLQPLPNLHDARIGRVILLAPVTAPFSDRALSGIEVPMLVVRAAHDRELLYPHHAARLARLAAKHAQLHVLADAGHFAFLTLPSGFDAPAAMHERTGFDRRLAHQRVDGWVLHFLDDWSRHVKAKRGR